MDFLEAVKSLSIKVPGQKEYVINEAQTRNAFVEPFLKTLGYDPSNPQEVRPEFGANVDVPGVIKDKKVDYGILSEGRPIILIEVKHHGCNLASGYAQLAAYYAATESQVGILTNGIIYKFYTDLEKDNILDKHPFLELDMESFLDETAMQIKCLGKGYFDILDIKEKAKELRYMKGIKDVFRGQMKEPNQEFCRFFFKELFPDRPFTGKVKDDFGKYVMKSFQDFIDDSIKQKLDALKNEPVSDSIPTSIGDEENLNEASIPIETTPQELEGFAVVKSILHPICNVDRLKIRDKISYCGILLDDKNNKPIIRLHFNNLDKLKISVFDGTGSTAKDREEIINIGSINELYNYADRIKATLDVYEMATV